MKMNDESLKEHQRLLFDVLLADKTLVEQMKIYGEMADTYDQICEDGMYRFPEVLVDEFLTLKLPPVVKILDVGAGTGLNGKCLRSHGYTNIDASDGCEQMLKHAKEKLLYNNYIHALVVEDKLLPIPEDTYDVALMAGSVSPAHIDVKAYKQIIRVVKPGGIIGWIIDDADTCSKVSSIFYDNFVKTIGKFVVEHQWIPVEGYNPKAVRNAALQMPGDVYFYKVL